MTDLDTPYRMPAGVLHAEIDGEEVLLNPDTGMYHLVNRTGRSLLTRMASGETLDRAIRTLSDEAGEEEQRVRGDALTFVEAMVDRGLLEAATD